jgi:poly(A) polymerase
VNSMAVRIMTSDGTAVGGPAGLNDRPFPVPPLAARIFALAEQSGFEARIVGGAVRDWLAGRRIGDIDMAVAAPIDHVAAVLRDQGLKVIETGLDHGTVTVVDQGQHLEITQTRVDLETDGRHAVVAFSDDWAADAARRDFTINALYVDASGQIFDPLVGRPDLAAGILRFVGNATQRVEEDALRMLRYCRFLPHFGRAGTDAEALAALGEKAGLAANLSGERVAGEMTGLLAGPGSGPGIAVMQDTGLAVAALGTTLDAGCLSAGIDQAVETVFGGADQAWLVRLAVLTPPGSGDGLATRLRLSRRDSLVLSSLDLDAADKEADALTAATWRQAAWWRHRADVMPGGGLPLASLVVASGRTGRAIDSAHLADMAAWEMPEFPLTGADLLSQGVDSGPALGEMLRAAEREWVGRDFAPTKADLLAFVEHHPVT